MKTKSLIFVVAVVAIMLLAVPVLVEAKRPGSGTANFLQWWDASDQAIHGGDCSPYFVYRTTQGQTVNYRFAELDSWCYCGDTFSVGDYSGYIGYETYWKEEITNDDFPYNDGGTQCTPWGPTCEGC